MKKERAKFGDIKIIPLEDQICPWKLSKQIVELGGDTDSYFKWVHPWSRIIYKENKRKYIICEWFHVSKRNNYPAYTITELSFPISDYIIGFHNWSGWYCKDILDRQCDIRYYHTLIEACAHCYISILKGVREEALEEALIKERGVI
jgi:hypothetical protein